MTCQLTTSNTIPRFMTTAGPTTGFFYYAMEFLEGVQLDRFDQAAWPQPEGG